MHFLSTTRSIFQKRLPVTCCQARANHSHGPCERSKPRLISVMVTIRWLRLAGDGHQLEHLLESRPRKSRAAFNSVSFPLVEERNFLEAPPAKRGFSSVGRASALQAECQRFESVNLHHLSRSVSSFRGNTWGAHGSWKLIGPVAQLVRAPP